MSTEQTPGPWEVFWIASPAGTSARITTVPTLEGHVRDVAHVPREWNAEGDAPLLAAAPTLADALELILSADCKGPCALERGHPTELHDLARSVLRAAGRLP